MIWAPDPSQIRGLPTSAAETRILPGVGHAEIIGQQRKISEEVVRTDDGVEVERAMRVTPHLEALHQMKRVRMAGIQSRELEVLAVDRYCAIGCIVDRVTGKIGQ